MSILKIRSGSNATGMLRYCHQDKPNQSADVERCSDFINSYGFNNTDDVSLAWRMERQGCGKENGRQYYHATLSISPDDPRSSTITNRELRDMGERFVKEFAPKHSHAVFVHRDERHPHIHILWNSVNPENGKKFHLDNAALGRSQEIKNRIDSDFGIQKTELRKPEVQKDRIPDEVKRIAERTEAAYIWTEDLKQRIDNAKKKSIDMEDFKHRLKENGVDAQERGKEGKITYSFEDEHGKQRKVRQDKLGEDHGRDSIEEAIRSNVQREFCQRKTSEQLSIHSIPDSGNEGRADAVLPGAFQKRRDDRCQTSENAPSYKEKSDIRGPDQDTFSGTGRGQEGLQRVLQTNDAANHDGRSPSKTHGSDEGKDSGRQRAFQHAEGNTAGSSEAGRGSEETSQGISFHDDRSIQGLPRSGSESREKTGGNIRQTGFHGVHDAEHGYGAEEESFKPVPRIRPDFHPEISSGNRSGSPCSDTDSVRDVHLKTTDNRESDVDSTEKERDIYARVRTIFEKSIEKLEEWRDAIVSRIRGTTVEGRDRPHKHGEPGGDSRLHETVPKNAHPDADSYGRNSSERIAEFAHDSSKRAGDHEDNSSGRTAQYQYDSFRRTGEYSSALSERREENQALLQFRVEDAFRELHKEAERVESLCNSIGAEIERREHEHNQKKIIVKRREKSEEMEIDF